MRESPQEKTTGFWSTVVCYVKGVLHVCGADMETVEAGAQCGACMRLLRLKISRPDDRNVYD